MLLLHWLIDNSVTVELFLLYQVYNCIAICFNCFKVRSLFNVGE
ncbi:hypothetical protein kac65v162_gp062 [Nodularia phage vB_NspS-kac65v162]|uniref:Uncharacterized protein n=3 Tax=Ravarandavirus kac65v151 TaxID=2845689 RepID=A0A482MJC9_9CAUD|nr:hypothetical protein HWC12_gp062 [Nodularia phage vB_NspS-kac65v151]QBQ73092.1 hypothetical protein kac65v151_gp062 [Nodularia phage vB_NspS-kac65v151]QBQ73300.1 hypothetical protein kac65v161_gp062 [Nodularia phage vB_NspS-kac65v161]QBQ73506.1 hypothetical protein kac65v162_gp062 [Nodularia phage vB_NspS-kac65v162]